MSAEGGQLWFQAGRRRALPANRVSGQKIGTEFSYGQEVTIIGAGSVGSHDRLYMAVNGIATEVVMIDINESKSLGEALDIRQGRRFPARPHLDLPPAPIRTRRIRHCHPDFRRRQKARPVPSGPGTDQRQHHQVDHPRKSPGTRPNAIYIIVANPVDILTYTFHKVSWPPREPDPRLRPPSSTPPACARALPSTSRSTSGNVHAYVYGEHGDSSFVPWSLGTIANIPDRQVPRLPDRRQQEHDPRAPTTTS